MSLVGLVQVMLRHWVVTVAILVITVSTGVGFWVSVEPEFEADAVVVVFPSGRTNIDELENPLEQLSSRSNSIVATVISHNVNSVRWRDDLVLEGFERRYLIDAGDGSTPTISISVTSDDRTLAAASRDRLMQALVEELEAMQDELGVTVEDRFTLYPLTVDPARALYGSRDRLVIGTTLLGIMAAIGVALVLDSIARSRGRSRTLQGVADEASVRR